jgi:hypothetical protein
MTSLLPLYDTLAERLTKRVNQENFSITDEYRKKLESILNTLDPAHADQIVLLLIHYYFLEHPNINPFTLENCTVKPTSRNNTSNLPYGIKPGPSRKGLSFDPNETPMPLQALLGTYCGI